MNNLYWKAAWGGVLKDRGGWRAAPIDIRRGGALFACAQYARRMPVVRGNTRRLLAIGQALKKRLGGCIVRLIDNGARGISGVLWSRVICIGSLVVGRSV